MTAPCQIGEHNQETTPTIQASDIEKRYAMPGGELRVLSKINLTLQPGAMVAIVGSSGTGKTTFLHILGGLDRPSTGTIEIAGKNIWRMNASELCQFRNRTIGFVFQFHYLLPEFTALENTIMPGLIAGDNREQLKKRGATLLDRVGLGNRTSHKIGELSGGEQQRVALARALIMEPRLLLADEPTGNLDPKTGQMVFDLIRELNASFGLTTVMVTHNMDLAAQMDHTYRLADGGLSPE